MNSTPYLDEIFADAHLTNLFDKFLQERFCEENLAFFRAATAYKALSSEAERIAAARTIFSNFIASDAQLEINIPSTTRVPLEKSIFTGAEGVFDAAIIDCKRMLEWDSAPGFIAHGSYLGSRPLSFHLLSS